MPITYDQTGVTYDAAAYTYNGDGYQPTVFPIAGVYISFTDGPYTAAPAWTEVTQYVRSITTHRGRASDLDQFDTGTAQIVLDNRDRRFDPFYTSGPYYPNGLTPRRPVRIVGQIGGQTYEVFRGFVAGWPVTWSEAGKDSTVTIQCFDALGLMANEQVPTDWPRYYTESLSPLHYYKGNDSRGSQTIKDFGRLPYNLNRLTTSSPFIFEAASQTDGLTGNAIYAPSYSTWPTGGSSAAYPMASTIVDFGFTGWITFTGSTGNAAIFQVTYGNGSVNFTYWQKTGLQPAGTLQIFINGTSYGFTYAITQQITATQPIFYAVNFDAATQTLQIKVNDVDVTSTRSADATRLSAAQDFVFLQGVTVQDLAIWERKLTATEQTNLYNYGLGRLTETTSARMQRLLDTTDWPAALESFPASPVATVAEIGSGTGVVPELQLVADSEGGELYVSKTGVLTMTARRDVFNATRSAVSQATFTDSGVGIRYGTELNIEYDADNLKNDITVNYSGDGEVNLYSDAVITGYGAAATTIETQLDSPTSALDLATLELGVEGVLIPQISPIDVSPNTAAADWQTILGLELLDRVTFKRTPTVGNQFDRAALINAIDHQIEPGVWRTQLTLSMRYTSPLICDDPVRGRVDYNYCG